MNYKYFSYEKLFSKEVKLIFKKGKWDSFLKSELRMWIFFKFSKFKSLPFETEKYRKMYEVITKRFKMDNFRIYILYCLSKYDLETILSIQLAYEEAYLQQIAIELGLNYCLLGINKEECVLINKNNNAVAYDYFLQKAKEINFKENEAEAIKSLDARVVGKYDQTSIFWMPKNLPKINKEHEFLIKEKIRLLFSNNYSINNVYFLCFHSFTDSPNAVHDSFQERYIDYFHASISFIKENINDSLILYKYHPESFDRLKERDRIFVNTLEKLFNSNDLYRRNLIRVEDGFNIKVAKKISDFILSDYNIEPILASCRGSILVEAAYAGLQTMSLYPCLYNRLGICTYYKENRRISKEEAKKNAILYESLKF